MLLNFHCQAETIHLILVPVNTLRHWQAEAALVLIPVKLICDLWQVT